MRWQLSLDLGDRSSLIYIENGLSARLHSELQALCPSKKAFIVTDSNVDRLYGGALCERLRENGFDVHSYAVRAGEASKSLDTAGWVYAALAEAGVTRGDAVIALGGGVVGDLAGFAAATFLRGVPLIQIPTTLLAQVDSSIGGKTAINLPQGKNLVGAFYQPKAVFIDPAALDTLPDKYFRDGMAEVIKYGFIKDAGLLGLLEGLDGRSGVTENAEEIICRCCSIKKEVVEKDERDAGERMLMNFGHTLGHAVELLSGYGYSHGESVAIGMYAAGRLGEAAGITEQGTADRIKRVLTRYGLPYELPEINMERLREIIGRDKKRLGGEINFILLERPGKAVIHKAGFHGQALDLLRTGGIIDAGQA